MEDLDGKLTAFEFKWNPKAKTRHPNKFLETYPGSEFGIITPSSYQEFLNLIVAPRKVDTEWQKND